MYIGNVIAFFMEDTDVKYFKILFRDNSIQLQYIF